MHLITGYAGEEHVTSDNAGFENAQVFGNRNIVFEAGNMFNATVLSNNIVQILDGEGMMHGRHFQLNRGNYEDIYIDNGVAGYSRHDLIVVRYENSTITGIESTEFVVIKGERVHENPSDPEYIDGDIIDGAKVSDFPLWRVVIQDLEIIQLVPLFEVEPSISLTIKSLSEKLGFFELDDNLVRILKDIVTEHDIRANGIEAVSGNFSELTADGDISCGGSMFPATGGAVASGVQAVTKGGTVYNALTNGSLAWKTSNTIMSNTSIYAGASSDRHRVSIGSNASSSTNPNRRGLYDTDFAKWIAWFDDTDTDNVSTRIIEKGTAYQMSSYMRSAKNIRYGTASINSSSATAINFSSDLGGTPVVMCTYTTTDSGDLGAIKVTARSKSGFSALIGGSSSTTKRTIAYLAFYNG